MRLQVEEVDESEADEEENRPEAKKSIKYSVARKKTFCGPLVSLREMERDSRGKQKEKKNDENESNSLGHKSSKFSSC